MFRYLGVILLLFSGSAYAEWESVIDTSPTNTTSKIAVCNNWFNSDPIGPKACEHGYNAARGHHVIKYGWLGDGEPTLLDGLAIVNHVYSNSQCVSAYGEGYRSTGETEDGTGNGCTDSPLLTPQDEQCIAITANRANFIALNSPQVGDFTWTSGGCEFKTFGTWIETASGQFQAQYNAVGAVPNTDPEDIVDDTVTPPSDGRESSGDFVETSDPSNDCPYSNFSFGGTSYCYNGFDSDKGSGYSDGSSRVNHWDGSFTITDSNGNSTTYNPDGSEKNPGTAPTNPGQGAGYLNNGCPSWAPEWLCSGDSSETDGLVGLFTEGLPDADGLFEGSSLEETMGDLEGEGDGYSSGLTSEFDKLDNGIAEEVTAHLPSTPGGGCSTLTFGNGRYSFEISCDVFNKIRSWLGWIVYFWTAVSIIDIFFAPTTRGK